MIAGTINSVRYEIQAYNQNGKLVARISCPTLQRALAAQQSVADKYGFARVSESLVVAGN